MDQYDILIAGSGAAGLSLAYYLSLSPTLKNKKILLLDRDLKQQNDRTWGFWTKNQSPYSEIISQTFHKAEFISREFSAILPLYPYRYQVLEGIRFYEFVLCHLAQFPNFHFQQEEIISMESFEAHAEVRTSKSTYLAPWVFNSCLLNEKTKKEATSSLYLQQHFKGWLIKTPKPAFDPQTIRLFDFRTPQEGKMCFFYLIPQAPDQALVEYTLFSGTLLEPKAYDTAIQYYIRNVLQLPEFEVLDQEWGVIPMTTFPFPTQTGKRIINFGSVGGASKASTGYTFLRIQEQCKRIVEQLEKDSPPYLSPLSKPRFKLYDDMLLNIMDKNGGSSEGIFSQLFYKNPAPRILKFLDEATNPLEEMMIMNSVPRKKFIKSFFNLKFGPSLFPKNN